MNNDWKSFGINEGQGSNTVSSYSTWDYMRIEQPKRICRCDLFGQGQMVISFYDAQSSPVPNRWIRFWTRVFFNSKWNFEND
jgi:hypothetical protein